MNKRNHSQLSMKFRRLALAFVNKRHIVPSSIKNKALLALVKATGGFPNEPTTRIEKYKWAIEHINLVDNWDKDVIKPAIISKTFVKPTIKQKKSFYLSREWQRLRYQALKMYGGCCQCCGNRPSEGNPLHVDHIKPISKFPELKLNFDNLQILCAECNLGKSNLDSTDWRCLSIKVPVYS